MTRSTAVPAIGSQASASTERSLSWWQYASFTVSHTLASWLLAVLSLSGMYQFGRLLGTIEWLMDYKRRRRYHAAFERVLGRKPTPSERRRSAHRYFMRCRCDKLFFLTFDRMSKPAVMARFTIRNRNLLDEALARGHGAYIALAHQGDHHVLGFLLAQCGYRLVGVRDRKEGAIRRYVQERLDRVSPDLPRMKILFSDVFPREMYRALQSGGVLMSLMDVAYVRYQHQKMKSVGDVEGQRQFVSGPLRIALRCKSPVLQAFFIPGKGFRYTLDIVGMILDPEAATDEEHAAGQALEVYAANVEHFMHQYPELISRV